MSIGHTVTTVGKLGWFKEGFLYLPFFPPAIPTLVSVAGDLVVGLPDRTNCTSLCSEVLFFCHRCPATPARRPSADQAPQSAALPINVAACGDTASGGRAGRQVCARRSEAR